MCETDEKDVGDLEKMCETDEKAGADREKPPEDMLVAWMNVRNSKEPSFKKIACNAVPLSCTMDDFYDRFLSDNAPCSMASYQINVGGDTDFETSTWSGSFTQKRTMQYTHPVNAPMFPPAARATKTQELRCFGKYGLCLETKTVVNDMPLTDCFFVEDRLLVEPRPEGGVNMTAAFELRFIKSTMFRRIIENTTQGELLKYWKGYVNMTKDVLAKEKGTEEPPPPVTTQKIIVEQPQMEQWLRLVILGGIIFMVSLQLFLLQKLQILEALVHLLQSDLQSCKLTSSGAV